MLTAFAESNHKAPRYAGSATLLLSASRQRRPTPKITCSVL